MGEFFYQYIKLKFKNNHLIQINDHFRISIAVFNILYVIFNKMNKMIDIIVIIVISEFKINFI